MVLGVTSTEAGGLDLVMLRDLFGYSPNDKFEITRPGKVVLTGELVWLERVAKENYTGPISNISQLDVPYPEVP